MTQPYAWAIDACSRMWRGEFAEMDAKAEAARCGGTCTAFPLYIQPAQHTPLTSDQMQAYGQSCREAALADTALSITVGQYRIEPGWTEGKVWIYSQSGEGGEFSVDALSGLIDVFYRENF